MRFNACIQFVCLHPDLLLTRMLKRDLTNSDQIRSGGENRICLTYANPTKPNNH